MSDITSYGDMVVCGQYDRRTDGHHRQILHFKKTIRLNN